MMRQAVADGVFPGAVLRVIKDGQTAFSRAYGAANIFSRRPVREATVFDLASLTKPLATALAVLILVQEGGAGLDQPLEELLPCFGRRRKGKITVRQLLAHTSGLPDYRPYYLEVSRLEPEKRRQALNWLVAAEPLKAAPGLGTQYSDLGFMLLRRVVEAVSGLRLDRFVEQRICRPMGLEDLFFIALDRPPPAREYAATEVCPWRGFLVEGQVHDENTWAVGGVDGQAGLFGTAEAVGTLLSELLAAYNGQPGLGLFDPRAVREFLLPNGPGERALGFDTPSLEGSSSGHRFSKQTVGHLGFSGTSFWIDLTRNVAVVLLTNRIHPSRENGRIRAFRPKIHDAVMEGLSF